jgi:hypothetical protein
LLFDDFANPITVHYDLLSSVLNAVTRGCIAGGQKEAESVDLFRRRGAGAALPFYLPHATILLIAAWLKSEREDLERGDYVAIGKTIARIQTQFDQRRNS